MMRLAIVALAAAWSLTTTPEPASAKEWPWCADYGGSRGGTTNCGFASWEQCQVTIRGIGGWCYRNPYYRPEPRRRSRRSY